MPSAAVNLLGMPQTELEALFDTFGERPFRARQVMRWIYGRSVLDPALMTDLSMDLREKLAATAPMNLPVINTVRKSADGTVKWQLDVGQNQAIEMVYIPEPARGTLCVSSQVGCPLNCSFCATGSQGFNRNLTAAEIIGQVLLARQELGTGDNQSPITNVVFMGMGEPLSNFRPVVQATNLLVDDLGLGLSRRRVTVSTAGLVPQIRRLSKLSNVSLAVSLHAADDELRSQLVPINRIHPIAELMEVCWEYARETNAKSITFEYVLLDGINDSVDHARRLARLLVNRPASANLIPFNPFPGSAYRRSPAAVIDRFRQVLVEKGVMTMTRRPRGDDIEAACGQLAGRIHNRVRKPLGTRRSGLEGSSATL